MPRLISSGRFRFGVFEIDLVSGELRKRGIRIKLHDQPFKVLAMLVERPGEVITREEFRESLWPADTFVDWDLGLNSAVMKLRAALGDSAENPRFIETLPRRGYRLIVPVEPIGTVQKCKSVGPLGCRRARHTEHGSIGVLRGSRAARRGFEHRD